MTPPSWEVTFTLAAAGCVTTRSVLVLAESEEAAKAAVVEWLADEPFAVTPVYTAPGRVVIDGLRRPVREEIE